MGDGASGRLDVRTSGGAGLAEGPLARRTWEELTGWDRRAQGPLLWERDGREGWEGEGCVFSKRLAALGMAYWSDMTDLDTGEWLNWAQVAVREVWSHGDRYVEGV